MVGKSYDWEGGAPLEEHTKTKHKILRAYFQQYLVTRCQLPQRERFRMVIVDGFAGGGCYANGEPGSPLIFLDVLKETTRSINVTRAIQGMKPIVVECLFLLNDKEPSVVQQLRSNIAPLEIQAKDVPQLKVTIEYLNGTFERVYPQIRKRLLQAKCGNVFFNLDQCGYSHVTTQVIREIMTSWKKAEVILTFMIKSLLAYLSPTKGTENIPLDPVVREKIDTILEDQGLLAKREWLGEAEKIVFDHLADCATYVSPFSIGNPKGWRYWLMHFANVPRARQVYNDILHSNETTQSHFGRSGLNMLAYDPQLDQGKLYLFDESSRQLAQESLIEDVERLVAESGDAMSVEDFFASTYSATPAHSDDINQSIVDNPNIEIVTSTGGKRRSAKTIRLDDMLKLTSQKSFILGFN